MISENNFADMGSYNALKIIVGAILAALVIVLVCFLYFCRKKPARDDSGELGSFDDKKKRQEEVKEEEEEEEEEEDDELEEEDLIRFNGGEGLTIQDILDAPGEVIGKSSNGTLYKASLLTTNSMALLRFVRPAACAGKKVENVVGVIQMLGFIRHPNLVPLRAFYSGPRGEKLFVHPFIDGGNLSQFIRGGGIESRKWPVMFRISLGIIRGLDHLHHGLQRPVVHGNLKSKNILLDQNYNSYVSDYGLHLLLNPTSGQEMLETSAAEGYKAPELIKMKDASKESDIYSLGIILLEIITGKEPINENPSPSDQDLYLPDSMRNAIIDHRISDMFHPNILLSKSNHPHQVTEERLLKFVQLAMACCSPNPSLRPATKQVLRKLDEIGS